jgi:hypothetical protein
MSGNCFLHLMALECFHSLTIIQQLRRDALANYASLAENDKYFAKLMEIGEGGGALTRTTGKGLQGIEDLVAQGRATRFYDKVSGNPRVEVFQPTPFHRLYQKISWGLKERPAGLIDFNDADSYKEIIATAKCHWRMLHEQ